MKKVEILEEEDSILSCSIFTNETNLSFMHIYKIGFLEL